MDNAKQRDISVKVTGTTIVTTIDGTRTKSMYTEAADALVRALATSGNCNIQLYHNRAYSDFPSTGDEPITKQLLSAGLVERSAQHLDPGNPLHRLALNLEMAVDKMVQDAIGYYEYGVRTGQCNLTDYNTFREYLDDPNEPVLCEIPAHDILPANGVHYADWDEVTRDDPLIEIVLEALESRPEVSEVRFDAGRFSYAMHFRVGIHPHIIKERLGESVEVEPPEPIQSHPHSLDRALTAENVLKVNRAADYLYQKGLEHVSSHIERDKLASCARFEDMEYELEYMDESYESFLTATGIQDGSEGQKMVPIVLEVLKARSGIHMASFGEMDAGDRHFIVEYHPETVREHMGISHPDIPQKQVEQPPGPKVGR